MPAPETRRRARWTVLLVALLCGWAACGASAAGPARTNPAGDYMVLQAAGGTLTGSTLTVRLASGQGQGFALPARGAAAIPPLQFPVDQMLRDWTRHRQDRRPPLALLRVAGGARAGATTAVRLTRPRYRDGTVTFAAERLGAPTNVGGLSAPLLPLAADAAADFPARFGRTLLYVDPPNDILQFCESSIRNSTDKRLFGAGALLLWPQTLPISILSAGATTFADSGGPYYCSVDFSWDGYSISLTNRTGEDGKFSCRPAGSCLARPRRQSAVLEVGFELLK